MSYLLAAGCSWTDADFASDIDPTFDCSFPKWPKLLGKQLGISEVVNVGLCGAGNDYIFEQCYDKIIANKPKLVCVLLSGWDRQSIFDYIVNTSTDLTVYQMNKKNQYPHDHLWLKDYYKANAHVINMTYHLWINAFHAKTIINKTLRNIFLFQSFCEQHNINYILMQGIEQIPWPFGSCDFNVPGDRQLQDISNFIKHTLNSPYASKINDKNILGWPFFWQVGGYCVSDKLRKEGVNSKFLIHPSDDHPNALGHQTIADMFYKGYQDIYGKIS